MLAVGFLFGILFGVFILIVGIFFFFIIGFVFVRYFGKDYV